MKTLRLLAVSAAALGLVACGKDGPTGPAISYTGKTTVVAMDQSNVGTTASLASASASQFAGTSYGSTGSSSFTVMAASRTATTTYAKAFALIEGARKNRTVSVTGVTASETFQCQTSGSATINASVSDPQGTTASNGDWVTISFNQCNDGYETMTGSLRMEVIATDGASPSLDDPTSLTSGFPYQMKLTMTDFATTAADGTYSGASGEIVATVVWNAATYRLDKTLSGSGIAFASGDKTGVLAASLLTSIPGTSGYSMHAVDEFTSASATTMAANEWDMSARVCSLELAGCLDVEESPAFRKLVSDLYPQSGTIRITGLSGAYVEVTALDATGAITLTWNVPGSTGTVTTTWPCLNDPTFCK